MKHTYLYTLPENVSTDTWAIGRYYGQVDLGDPLLIHEDPIKYLNVQEFLLRFTDMVMDKLDHENRICVGPGYAVFGAFQDAIREGTSWEVEDITHELWNAPYLTMDLGAWILCRTRYLPEDAQYDTESLRKAWIKFNHGKRIIPVWM